MPERGGRTGKLRLAVIEKPARRGEKGDPNGTRDLAAALTRVEYDYRRNRLDGGGGSAALRKK